MARRATKTRPDPPDLAPRRDPAPAVLESSAVWDGVDADASAEVPAYVAGVRLQESLWVGADLSGRRLAGFECRDTAFVRCDLSGAVLEDALLTRVEFTECRLTGLVLSGATLRDVRIVDGRADLALLRMAKARHLWIEGTSLRGADLYAFEGADCAFLGCDLTDTVLDGARVPGLLLHGSTVDAVRGATALRGRADQPGAGRPARSGAAGGAGRRRDRTAPAVISADHARELALALPEAVEQAHHGFPSFRVRGRIFATLPDEHTLRVMLDADAVEEAVAAAPSQCAVLRWGAKVSGVAVHLAAADAETVADLLADAWRRRAPAVLLRAFDAGQSE